MAETDKTSVTAPIYQIKAPGLPANPVGLTSDPEIAAHYRESIEAQKQLLKSLEERYAQPNWFNIAAGFAKPQLGGFFASLGSASSELGKQVEAQRAMAPTLAQMRSEIAMKQIDLAQRMKAGKAAEDIVASGGVPTPAQAATVEAYSKGPEKVAEAGMSAEQQRIARFIAMFNAGVKETELIRAFGPDFVAQHLPKIQQLYGGQPGAPTPALAPTLPQVPGSAPPAVPGQPASEIPGVPAGILKDLTPEQRAAINAREAQERQALRDETNKSLGQQAQQGAKLVELASSLYRVASKPSLAKAFGVFEGGDPLSILGSVLEKQSVSSSLAGMRDYVTKGALGKQAMSDFQTFEGLLGELQTLIQQGIVNPTDVRTMFEIQSVPNARNNQDAILRGLARIGSEGLSKYETKLAFENALKRKDFDIRNWTTSPEVNEINKNLKSRRDAVVLNPAVSEKMIPLGMPEWMLKSPAEAAYKPKAAESESKGSQRSNERVIGGKTYVRQANGSWKLKE